MLFKKAVNVLLLSIFTAEVLIKLCTIFDRAGVREKIEFSDSWLFICVAIGVASLYLGKHRTSTPVLCLLLASMAGFLSYKDVAIFSDSKKLGETCGTLAQIFWYNLMGLSGFSFVHFALIFPVHSKLVRNNNNFPFYLYSVCILIITISGVFFGVSIVFFVIFLSMGAGVLVGLGILIRKYVYSLTFAEKNRLQVALIGCLAGALPALLTLVSDVLLEPHDRLLGFGLFLLPLFPLGLVAAVLKENFSEISKWLQRTLTYSLAMSGSITAFFFVYWLMILIDRGTGRLPNALIISTSLAILVIFPLLHFSQAYITSRFHAEDQSDSINKTNSQPFRRIEPNPYIVGNPIRATEQFFGRESDFEFIRNILGSETQGCVVVLCGERRTGKTSILFQIMNGRLGPRFLPVFIDMQGMVVRKDAEFLGELAARVYDAAGDGSLSAEDPPEAAIDSYPGFNRFMDQVAGRIGSRRMLILIDEYELIETKVKDKKLSPEIFNYFESLLVRYPWLSYVFTGSNTLERNEAWSMILAKSVYRRISFLDRKDARALICKPLHSKILYPQGMVNRILRLTNGHPFFTQVICQTLVEVLNETQTNVVRRQTVDEALHRVLENPPPQLYYQWRTFSDIEKLVLSALATLLKRPDRYLSPDKVEKLFRSLSKRIPEKMDATTIQMLMEDLREKSFMDRDQTRYRFVMDLMRIYIQNEHNMWKVMSEIRADGSVKRPGIEEEPT